MWDLSGCLYWHPCKNADLEGQAQALPTYNNMCPRDRKLDFMDTLQAALVYFRRQTVQRRSEPRRSR